MSDIAFEVTDLRASAPFAARKREPHRALFVWPVVTVDRLLTEGVMSDRANALVKELAQARAQIAEQVAEIARLRLRKPAAAEEHSQARHENQ
jgi:hypothetical protein